VVVLPAEAVRRELVVVCLAPAVLPAAECRAVVA
jgi:hypothetical protein